MFGSLGQNRYLCIEIKKENYELFYFLSKYVRSPE